MTRLVAVAFVVLLGACADDATTAPIAQRSTATAPPSAGQPAPAPGSAPTRVPDPPTSASASVSASRRPIEPASLRPPSTGVYRYRSKINKEEADGTIRVLAATAPSSKVTRQIFRHEGTGQSANEIVDWSTGGAAIVATSSSGGRCEFHPPMLLVTERLAEGATWRAAATCKTSAAGETVALERVEDVEVAGRARTTVDGDEVDTWLIRRHGTATERRDGRTIVVESASSELFAPGLGIFVYRVSRTDFPLSNGKVETVVSSLELLNAPGVS